MAKVCCEGKEKKKNMCQKEMLYGKCHGRRRQAKGMSELFFFVSGFAG